MAVCDSPTPSLWKKTSFECSAHGLASYNLSSAKLVQENFPEIDVPTVHPFVSAFTYSLKIPLHFDYRHDFFAQGVFD
jgi:hypothetical protein